MKLRRFSLKSNQSSTLQDSDVHSDKPNAKRALKKSLKENLLHIKHSLGNSSDIIIREVEVGKNAQIQVGIIYTEGLVNKSFINDFILESLLLDLRKTELDFTVNLEESSLQTFKKALLPIGEIKEISDFEGLFLHLLSGYTILLIDGISQGTALESRGWEDRGVAEPSSETVVRGPKDGFSETLRTNTALLRRRIKDPKLWIETIRVGRRTKTDVAIAYIKGVVSDKVVEEIHQRISNIDIDGILDSGYIEELIQDAPFSPFPTIYNTERPDKAAAGILEGRVGIIVDGTPFVLLAPAVFVQFFQAPEDYYHLFDISTLIRLLRFFSFMLTLLVPAVYIAVTTFHQEMIPTPLLTSIAAKREGVPFPAIVEVLLMEVTFEILREAGIRLPRVVGQTVSIVGALVIGEAAVQAGIVSALMVIVVSFTAICNFVIPSYSMAMALRILRFFILFLASFLGLFGILLGLLIMILHLCSLESFGVPYMSPMAPLIMEDQKDTLIRLPRFGTLRRPYFMAGKNNIRSKMHKK